MEPIYSVEILVPSDKMGDVMSDLQNRRAMIEGMSSDKDSNASWHAFRFRKCTATRLR